MAGVGFELRRMIEERRGVMAKVRAYSCAGLISSGPWLMTILTLTLLNLAGPYLGGTEGYSLFRALVTYAFAFSLILQGIAQMAVTRRVADLLYTKRYDAVLPAFAATTVGVGAVHALIGTAFCLWAGFSAVLSFLAVTLFAIIGMTWIALIWLTVVRQYDEVLRAYVYGTLVAMVGVVLLFLSRGTVGILAAYTAGQAFTLALLIRTIVRGMNASGGRDLSVFRSLVSFPLLVGVGLFYNAAIWVDKMIFWWQDGIGPHSLVRYHPLYDTCSFLAYLTVVPALAVNLVRLETAFYERYRGYYGAILGGTPLGVIEDKRRRMLRNLEESLVRLLKTQGAITALVILFAPVICDTLKLPPIAVRLFRLTCLGAFFHVLLLINILMQMYFDLRKQALATSLAFLALNGILAWWSVNRGVETYGIGYALASFMSLLLGYLLLYRSLDQLDYMTFTSQPIGSDEERREATVLAEQERAAEEAAAAEEAEEEDEERETPAPAPIVVAAGEMAPPEPVDEVAVEENVLEEQEAVPADAPRADVDATATELETHVPAAPVEAAPAAAIETATDLPEALPAPEPVPEVEPTPEATLETATDLPGEPKIAVPDTGEPDVAPTEAEPEPVAAAETATDLPREPKIALPAAAEPDATATEAEPATAAPLETATDL
ncbi:MAG: exopolysaccharide Pel transporter PelG, partial [Planctomycetota bacterium]